MKNVMVISFLGMVISTTALLIVIFKPSFVFEIQGIDHGSGDPFTLFIGGENGIRD